MTSMRRVTIALPDKIDKRILALRTNERFLRCSYSEIVRTILEHGIDLLDSNPTDNRFDIQGE